MSPPLSLSLSLSLSLPPSLLSHRESVDGGKLAVQVEEKFVRIKNVKVSIATQACCRKLYCQITVSGAMPLEL